MRLSRLAGTLVGIPAFQPPPASSVDGNGATSDAEGSNQTAIAAMRRRTRRIGMHRPIVQFRIAEKRIGFDVPVHAELIRYAACPISSRVPEQCGAAEHDSRLAIDSSTLVERDDAIFDAWSGAGARYQARAVT